MVEISIIVPVFNREKYISDCLDSVVNSTVFDKCEVIVIDDGSSDKSVEVIEKYTKTYKNIFLYVCSHRGVSISRNEGIRLAQGKYIYFLDSDDFIKSDYIEKLYLSIEKKGCDVVYAGYSVYNNGSVLAVERPHLSLGRVMSGCEYIERRMDGEDWINQPWCAIYNRNFITEKFLYFPENILVYEDLFFTNRILLYAQSVYMIPDYGYMYRTHEESLVQGGVTPDQIEFCLTMMEMFCEEYSRLDKKQKHAIGRVYFQFLSMILYCMGDVNAENKQRFNLRLSKMKLWIPLARSVSTVKEAVKLIVFRINWNLFYLITKK